MLDSYARTVNIHAVSSSQELELSLEVYHYPVRFITTELTAALINTHSDEVIRRSFGPLHKSSLKFTDSQIALHWITNETKPRKQWVRNLSIEINRFTHKDQWKYLQTNNMMADLGTRRGATFADINQHSSWINGLPWMRQDVSKFPMESAEELRLSNTQISEVEKERTIQIHHASRNMKSLMEPVQQRYQFSQYLIDPNRHRFAVVVRIMAYVIRFCTIIINRVRQEVTPKSSSIVLTEEELNVAEKYFFRKGSSEVLHFLPKSSMRRYQLRGMEF